MSDNLLQIVAECAYITSDTASGRAKVLMMKGALFPADAPEAKHLLDSGMAIPVGGDVTGGLNADGDPDAAVQGRAPKDGEAPRSTPKKAAGKETTEPPPPDDLEALRAKAIAAGMDPAEVAKASEQDLRAVLK